MNDKLDINCELDVISQRLLIRLNDILSLQQKQVATLENDMSIFSGLHDLYYGIQYARMPDKSAHDASKKINKELKTIHSYLMINLRLMRNQHKRRLAYYRSEQREEEWADASRKAKLELYVSRTIQFVQRMELLLE